MACCSFHSLIAAVCAFFVTRAPKNLQFHLRTSRPVDRPRGARCDQTIRLTGIRTAQRAPDLLCRIVYDAAEKDLRRTFLTSHVSLLPLLTAQLYRVRWQVELCFRRIQQHLRIKALYTTSQNTVKTRGWVALWAYVLVAIAQKPLGLDMSLYQILESLSVTIFEKTPILEGLSSFTDQSPDFDTGIQLSLFDF